MKLTANSRVIACFIMGELEQLEKDFFEYWIHVRRQVHLDTCQTELGD
jgi:hypothetical protein